ENWVICEAVLPHALSLLSVYGQFSGSVKGSMIFAELLSDVGNYLWERSLLKDGLNCLTTADSICNQHFKLKDTDYSLIEHSKILTLLGCIHLYTGPMARGESLEAYLRSLKLRQR